MLLVHVYPACKNCAIYIAKSAYEKLEEGQEYNPLTQFYRLTWKLPVNLLYVCVCVCVNYAKQDRSSISQQPRPPATPWT